MKTLFSLIAALLWLSSCSVERAKYNLISETDDYQIRQYQSRIVAETIVQGNSLEDAGSAGFQPLAAYIFAKERPGEKIAMTAPVGTSQSPSRTKIAMTAPVGTEAVPGQKNQWLIQFTMPSKWTMETIPKPGNPKVKLREIKGEKVAVRVFSGRWKQELFDEQASLLIEAIKKDGVQIIGAPSYQRYDPPWKPSFLRTNEVWIPVL